jgi:release factor glutamine methyltransferase
VLEQPKSWLLAHTEAKFSLEQICTLNDMVLRLTAGEPLAYLIGHWSFFGLDFFVDKSVLIPRPETELLVEKAIDWLSKYPNAHSILDIGTGSGCIAITLASAFPDRDFVATDIVYSTLGVARKNILLHSTYNIHLVACDLMNSLDRKFDLICANPPYIPTGLLKTLPVGNHEPWLALDGGENGIETISRFIEESSHHLERKGIVLMEIESTKKEQVLNISRNFFPTADIQIQDDLAGNARLLMIQSR